ncbi:MAG: hypothetical protein ACC662_12145 [Planctomycetota bacterium]
MDSIRDFEDMLSLLNQHGVRYLIVGGLAFVYHAKPRFTKDMDIWIEPAPENLARANQALVEFGGPTSMSLDNPDEIVQIGVAPNRIDLIQSLEGVSFDEAWTSRVVDLYGEIQANWISLDGLLRIKERIDLPRHQEDARILREVRRLRGG